MHKTVEELYDGGNADKTLEEELETFEQLCNELSESVAELRKLIEEPMKDATSEEIFDSLNERGELFVYLKGRYMGSAKLLPGTRFPSFMRDGNWVADVGDDEIWGDVDSYIPPISPTEERQAEDDRRRAIGE